MRTMLVATIAMLMATPTLAGRAVTEAERAELVKAVAAAGCSGGKMEWDSPHFEVDDVRCADGKTYDLKFDQTYKLVGKKIED
jgi:hypothetical protein